MITFEISSDGASITVTGTTDAYVIPAGNTLTFSVDGSINGEIASLVLSAQQEISFAAKTPFIITADTLTDGSYSILPDDFYKLQITEKDDQGAVVELSDVAVLSSYFWIQKRLHDEIVSTNRVLSFYSVQSLHSRFIHLHAIELYGQNPPLSKEDAVVSRINYLKTA
jgi:hypothetical protein